MSDDKEKQLAEEKRKAAAKAREEALKKLKEKKALEESKEPADEEKEKQLAEEKRKAAEKAREEALKKIEEKKAAQSSETAAEEDKEKELAEAKAKAAAKARAEALKKMKEKEAQENSEEASGDELAIAKAKAAAAAKAKAAAAAKAKAEALKKMKENEAQGAGEDEKAKAIAAAKAKAAAAAKAKALAQAKAQGKAAGEPVEETPSPKQPILDRYVKIIKENLGDDILEDAYINRKSKDVPTLVVKKEHYFKLAQFLKHNELLSFDYLSEHHASDFETHMEVYNYLFSYKTHESVVLKTKIDRNNPVIESVTPVWEGANWPEREAYDLLGVHYTNHPNLTRILLPDDWIGHPLRKDYVPFDEGV